MQEQDNKFWDFVSFLLNLFLIAPITNSLLGLPKDKIIVSLFVTAIVLLLCMLTHYAIIIVLSKARKEGINAGFSRIKEEVVYCTQKKDKGELSLCQLEIAHNYGLYDSKNRLYGKQYIDEKEKIEENESAWKNIWIFSKDLATEVENGKAEHIVVENIENFSTKYTFFYLQPHDGDTQKIKKRKKEIQGSVNDNSKSLISFVPIKNDNKLGEIVLPLLCGSILFSLETENDSEPISLPKFSEGYLSIRKDNELKPIYYKMTNCMLTGYSKYFKEAFQRSPEYINKLQEYENKLQEIKSQINKQ